MTAAAPRSAQRPHAPAGSFATLFHVPCCAQKPSEQVSPSEHPAGSCHSKHPLAPFAHVWDATPVTHWLAPSLHSSLQLVLLPSPASPGSLELPSANPRHPATGPAATRQTKLICVILMVRARSTFHTATNSPKPGGRVGRAGGAYQQLWTADHLSLRASLRR